MHLLQDVMFTHSASGDLIVVASMQTAMVLGLNDDANRMLLWIVDRHSYLGCVDVKTSKCNVVGRLGIPMSDITIDSQGRLLGINGRDLYEINTSTARLKLLDTPLDGGEMPRPTSRAIQSAALPVERFRLAAHDLSETRSATALAFDMARFFMGWVLDEPEDMVQLAVLDGRSMEIGVFGHGTIYGRAKSHLSLFDTAGTRVYTTNPQTGQPMPVTEHPGPRIMPRRQKAGLVES